jgi:hypothetical protein
VLVGAAGLAALALVMSYQLWRQQYGSPRPVLGYLLFALDSLMSIAGGVSLLVLLGFPRGGGDMGHALVSIVLSLIIMAIGTAFIGVKLVSQHEIRRKCIGYACVLALVALCVARVHFNGSADGT